MGLRETINQKKSISYIGAVFLVVIAGGVLAYTQWPARIPKGDTAYYTDDDGQTWFTDSVYKTPPFDHNGKTAVRALVYTYENGHKTFCPVLERYNSAMKKELDEAISAANHDGKPLSSISIFNAPGTVYQMDVKLAGSGHEWVSRGNMTQSNKVFEAVQAPDGSTVDLAIP